MADLGYPGAVVRATDAAFQADIAAVREAGLNIMMSMKGDGKPVSFIEDCAVDLDDLADYTERLNDVFARHGTKGTWYAHASVGCLHVRPVLNMKDPADVATMRAVAEECFALVREYKGSHSGEHGDGIVRSEFHAADVRRAHRARVRDGEGCVRPDWPAEPRPHRARRRAWMTARCSATAGLCPGRRLHAEARLVRASRPARRHARRGRDVQQQRHLPRIRRRRDVPELPGDARRAAPHARPRQHAAPGADRPARRGRDGLGRGGRGDEALRLLQGVPARMPDRRRHGEDEDRGAGGARRSARHLGAGPADRRTCRAWRPTRLASPLANRATASPGCVDRARCGSASPPSVPCRVPARCLPRRRSDRRPGTRGEVLLFADTFNR